MSRNTARNFEIKLGLSQLVVLVGILSGTMVCVFYLGFFSGRRAGFESAMDSSASNFVKLPISDQQDLVRDDEVTTEVYAKLDERRLPSKADVESSKGQAVPELQSIKSTDASPIGDEDSNDIAKAKAKLAGPVKIAKRDIPEPKIAARNSDDSALPDEDMLSVGAVLGDEPSARAGFKGPDSDADASLSAKPSRLSKGETLGSLAQRNRVEDADEVLHENEPSRRAGKLIEVNPTDVKSAKPLSASKLTVAKLAKEERQSPADNAKTGSKEKTKPSSEKTPTSAVLSSVEDAQVARKKAETEILKSDPQLKEVVPAGWFAQVGAPNRYEDAKRVASQLKESGFPVIIESAKVRGESYYRILVGPEDTRSQGERLVSQLRREPGLPAAPFLRMVK